MSSTLALVPVIATSGDVNDAQRNSIRSMRDMWLSDRAELVNLTHQVELKMINLEREMCATGELQEPELFNMASQPAIHANRAVPAEPTVSTELFNMFSQLASHANRPRLPGRPAISVKPAVPVEPAVPAESMIPPGPAVPAEPPHHGTPAVNTPNHRCRLQPLRKIGAHHGKVLDGTPRPLPSRNEETPR